MKRQNDFGRGEENAGPDSSGEEPHLRIGLPAVFFKAEGKIAIEAAGGAGPIGKRPGLDLAPRRMTIRRSRGER